MIQISPHFILKKSKKSQRTRTVECKIPRKEKTTLEYIGSGKEGQLSTID